MKHKIDAFFLAFLIAMLFPIEVAYGIQFSTSGGSSVGGSGSVSQNIIASNNAAVNSVVTINGASVTPTMRIIGPTQLFKETHGVTDGTKSASVNVEVGNAQSGLTYSSQVLPGEGTVTVQPSVSAEQWLTVPKADYIITKCAAALSNGALSSDVGLEETKSTAIGDYVTLNGYDGKAIATTSSVSASQIATSGSANSIKIYGNAKDSSVSYNVNTPLTGISGGKATFNTLNDQSSAGTTTQVAQTEHVNGGFTSKLTAGTKTNTRTSNYGTNYDLNLLAKKSASGPSVSGMVGYYVNPSTSANKIQGAINAAQSGDSVNVLAGTYKENVQIDKSLVINGAGKSKTIVDGNKAGSVFSIGSNSPSANVALSGMTIQNGQSSSGGGICNEGKLAVTDSIISSNTAGYGGGIYNDGTALLIGSTVSGNIANSKGGEGGGIFNYDNGKLTIQGASIVSGNSAYYNGGGIANSGLTIVTGSTISKNSANADNGGYGGGIYNYRITSNPNRDLAILNVANSGISMNTADIGGGIYNDGTAALGDRTLVNGNNANVGAGISDWTSGKLMMQGTTISGNIANYNGGGIDNEGLGTIITGSTISGNAATNGFGGGIYNYRDLTEGGTQIAKADITNSAISGNIAELGGGIFNYGIATLTGTTVSTNSATVKGGEGGGVYNCPDRNLVIQANSVISGNVAYYNGGGIANKGSATVTSSTISGNTASNGVGGGIFNYGDSSGGTWIPASLSVTGSTISSNAAADRGGGIYNDGTSTLTDSTVSANNANYGGGGIYSDADGRLTVQGSSNISWNIATNGHGGGIRNDGSLFIGGTTKISNNKATMGWGGGIYSDTKSVIIDGTKVAINQNKAHTPSPSELSWYQGWGIYLYTGIPTTTGGFNQATQVTGNTRI